MERIKQNVKAYILKEFLPGENPDKLTDDLELIRSGILDSLATLKLVTYLEETYNIAFAAHEVGVDNLKTINGIATFVLSKQPETVAQ